MGGEECVEIVCRYRGREEKKRKSRGEADRDRPYLPGQRPHLVAPPAVPATTRKTVITVLTIYTIYTVLTINTVLAVNSVIFSGVIF